MNDPLDRDRREPRRVVRINFVENPSFPSFFALLTPRACAQTCLGRREKEFNFKLIMRRLNASDVWGETSSVRKWPIFTLVASVVRSIFYYNIEIEDFLRRAALCRCLRIIDEFSRFVSVRVNGGIVRDVSRWNI